VICSYGLCLLRCLQVFGKMCRRKFRHTTLDITGGGGGLDNEEFIIYKIRGS
jgi:hypothetical protein